MTPIEVLSFSVIDYGATGDGVTDDSPAFQACIDAAALQQKAINGPAVAEIFVPMPKVCYVIKTALFLDQSNQKLIGSGAGPNIFSAWGGLYVGVRRMTPTPSHFPDAFGVLDLVAAPSLGKHFGLGSGGDTIAQFQSNGLQYGARDSAGTHDYWNKTQKLTIEFCIAFGKDGSAKKGARIFGFGTTEYASPWLVWVDGNDSHYWNFSFTTDGDKYPRRFSFAAPTTQGPFRITIQIDLTTAACVAFVNDVRVATTYSDLTSFYSYAKAWGPGLFIKANDSQPFIIGQDTDQTIYGLHLSNTIRYADTGVGNKIPAPITDNRYFTADQSTIGLLQLDSRQNGNQQVEVMQATNITSQGLILPLLAEWSSNITLENVNILGSWYSGAGIWIGPIFNVRLSKVSSYGLTGVTSLIRAATYNVTIQDCTFQGKDVPYFGYFQIIRATNLDFGQAGRDVMRLVSCNLNLLNGFVAGASTDTVFKFLAGGYGGAIRMVNVIVDFEGQTLNKAVVYCENQPYMPSTTLALVDFFVGTVGQVPCVMLTDTGAKGIYNKAWFSAENVSAWGAYSAFVQTDGPLWGGVVNAYFLNPKTLHQHVPTWGAVSAIQFTNVS